MLEQSDKYLYLYALYKTNQTLSSGWKLAENLDWIGVTLIRQTLLMAEKSTLFTENFLLPTSHDASTLEEGSVTETRQKSSSAPPTQSLIYKVI